MLDDHRAAEDLTCVLGIDLASQDTTVSLALLQRSSPDEAWNASLLRPWGHDQGWLPRLLGTGVVSLSARGRLVEVRPQRIAIDVPFGLPRTFEESVTTRRWTSARAVRYRATDRWVYDGRLGTTAPLSPVLDSLAWVTVRFLAACPVDANGVREPLSLQGTFTAGEATVFETYPSLLSWRSAVDAWLSDAAPGASPSPVPARLSPPSKRSGSRGFDAHDRDAMTCAVLATLDAEALCNGACGHLGPPNGTLPPPVADLQQEGAIWLDGTPRTGHGQTRPAMTGGPV